MNDVYSTFPTGYWIVKGKKFLNKVEALTYGAKLQQPVKFIYFDDVWDNFDRSLLGKFSLDELYKQRAQQLRDKYDYLILYFSGGSDSYNVLRSFIDNGIKLDEVCVKWAVDSNKVHKPNAKDTSAYNYMSEWDYAILPVLQELAVSNPEIKIEIVDWFKDFQNVNFEKIFATVLNWHDVEAASLSVWSPSEEKLVSQGKTVGSIYGVDKPITYFAGNEVYMLFNDYCTTMATPNPANPYGIEYFYWSHDFPLLSFEMAHVVGRWFCENEHFINMFAYSAETYYNVTYNAIAYQSQQRELRHVLYSNWTDRFQTAKPTEADRIDKQSWLLKSDELRPYYDKFKHHRDLYVKEVGGQKGPTAVHNANYLHLDNAKFYYPNVYSKKHLLFSRDSN